jgi:membrane protease YdiL (CAAX protease family)
MLLLVGGATLLLRTVGETWRDVGLSRPRFGRTTALVVVGYLATTLVYALISKLLFPALGLTPKTLSLFSAVQGDTAEYLYWLIPVAWGSAAFGEELVFRGYLQTRLAHAFGGRGGVALAVVLQAAVFGALHAYQGLGGAMVAAGAGLVLGLVYIAARKNLWAPILLHGLVDTVSINAVYFGVAGNAA